MTIAPNTFEFNLLYVLTLILITVKVLLSVFLLRRILIKKKEDGKFTMDFIFSIFILILCAAISRAIYFYYDFYLTQFDPDKLWRIPNVYYWKIAGFIGSCALSFVLFVTDKKVLSFKFKGIFAYFVLTIASIQLLWPINSSSDFIFVSSIGIYASLAAILLPIIFIYVGIKTPGLRKVCFMIVVGIIIYAIGSFLVSENILAPLREIYGSPAEITAFFLFLTFKITGLSLLAYSVTKFTL